MKYPPFHSFPNLENQNVLLRKIHEQDLECIIEISFYDGQKAKSIQQAREMNNQINENYQNGESIHWLIFDKKSNQIAGTCGFYRGFLNSSGEIGCVLLPHAQGKGIMLEALKLIIDFGIKEMKLHKIWTATDFENQKAIKLLDRLGFQEFSRHGNTVNYEMK